MKAELKIKSNVLLYFISIFSIIVFIVSCKPKDDSELIGAYIADYDIAKEKLILLKNGTFIQEVIIKSSKKIDFAKGKWTYNKRDGYITFDDSLLIIIDAFGEIIPNYDKREPGLVILPTAKFLFWIFIGNAEGVLYKKID